MAGHRRILDPACIRTAVWSSSSTRVRRRSISVKNEYPLNPLTVMHSLLFFPYFLQISDTGESLSLSRVNLFWGVFWPFLVNSLAEDGSHF